MSNMDFRNGASNANADYPLVAMDYTVSIYHDKRNTVTINQANANSNAPTDNVRTSNVGKQYALFFNGAAPVETTNAAAGPLNRASNGFFNS